MVGGKMSYLAMKTDYEAENALISSDLRELGNYLQQLANHGFLGGGLGFGISFLKWVAFCAAVYLLILDRTNWKTNILTSLLIPYIFLSLPNWLFHLLSWKMDCFYCCHPTLFLPRRFPDWLELPAALILIIVVAPSLIADNVRGHWVGLLICLIIGCCCKNTFEHRVGSGISSQGAMASQTLSGYSYSSCIRFGPSFFGLSR